MTGDELIRRVRWIGRERGVAVRFETRAGKGSQGRLHDGERFAAFKDRRKEIGKGLPAVMLRQLGLRLEDLGQRAMEERTMTQALTWPVKLERQEDGTGRPSVHVRGTKTRYRLKPSDAFARQFGEGHGVDLPFPIRRGHKPRSFSGGDAE